MLKIVFWYIICLQILKSAYGTFKKCYRDITSGYPIYPIFCQIMRNAFLGKIKFAPRQINFLF